MSLGHENFSNPLNNEEAAIVDEYLALAHAMQTGVAHEMNFNSRPTEPKHLRVGVNSSMVSHSALVDLLISKGVFTRLEYLTAMRDRMKAEVAGYQHRVSTHFGMPITLA